MILLIDNYDSFVHNLARYVWELGFEARVVRNDAISLRDIRSLNPTHIVISPGPRSPAEAGISTEVVRQLGSSIPVFGVCLGHQCIGAAYGGAIVRSIRPMHGKTSRIVHDGSSIFTGLPSPFCAARYHSLVIRRESLPDSLRLLAWSEAGEVMAVEHRNHRVIGVQFHPESAATEYGYILLARFLTGRTGEINELPLGADGGTEHSQQGTLAESPWTVRHEPTRFPAAAPLSLLRP